MSIKTRAPFMLDAETVAKVCNISLRSVYNAANKNTLPFPSEKIGSLYRFRRNEVEAFLGVSIDEALETETEVDDQKESA